jgi:tRNA modification GTPase
MNDTIAAISTALGVGAISIIRVSGNDAIKIVNSIFNGADLTKQKSHTIHYGYIMDKNKKVDEVLVSIMKAPKTFTAEDVVEINCHGGIITTNQILELLLENGVRLAEPGEFTKRAFLNGRIDLTQAESVMDLINAKTKMAKDMALKGLTGNISDLVRKLRDEILKILSNIAVNIDYPEYQDEEQITRELIETKIKDYKTKIETIINNAKEGRIVKEGIKTLIIGKPNVGKSSLLNRLINEEKAIVTDIAGTTRDIVEGKVILDGIELNIIDTAGIRDTKNKIEKIGVEKTKKLIPEADLILFLLNNNELISSKELDLLKKIKHKNVIVVVNKIDLKEKINLEEVKDYPIVKLSVLNNKGIVDLKNKIKELFNLEKIQTQDLTYLSNARQLSIFKEILNIIENIEVSIKNNIEIDMIEIDLKRIWMLLGEVIGETFDDQIIDEMFKNFCLGK